MMNTPLCDFVKQYIDSHTVRAHMPGHKGRSILGFEAFDLTEVDGADSLYEADGIINESEKNAASLFGSGHTFYSAEGSSLCIRAMLYLVLLYAGEKGRKPIIAAGRNAHKTFVTASGLLDIDIKWLYAKGGTSYLESFSDASYLDGFLSSSEEKLSAVFITSPDYLGNVADIASIAEVCRKHDVLLLVDNAHGAYLHFLESSRHPLDLGAHMCCDSAHKTLPVITGGAYLHIAAEAPEMFFKQARNAMSVFGSTSPSYLILQSLDAANKYLSESYRRKLGPFCKRLQAVKAALVSHGYTLIGDEPLKLTISAKPFGYTGHELSGLLSEKGVVCEFHDPDYLVMMFTPESENDCDLVRDALLSVERKQPINDAPPAVTEKVCVMSVRRAMTSHQEVVSAENAKGRILASANISCPPAVPVAVCGELLDDNSIGLFEYYGIKSCCVVK